MEFKASFYTLSLSNLDSLFHPNLKGSLLVILEIFSSIIANELTTAIKIKYNQSGYAIDPVALFEVLYPLLISVWYGGKWHGGKVSLERSLIAIVAAEDDLHALSFFINFIVEFC